MLHATCTDTFCFISEVKKNSLHMQSLQRARCGWTPAHVLHTAVVFCLALIQIQVLCVSRVVTSCLLPHKLALFTRIYIISWLGHSYFSVSKQYFQKYFSRKIIFSVTCSLLQQHFQVVLLLKYRNEELLLLLLKYNWKYQYFAEHYLTIRLWARNFYDVI